MKKNILFLMPVFLLFILCQNSNKKIETAQIFPSDTIPMQYIHQYPRFCMPILDGIVNDSLHFDVFFDTGSPGGNFYISDSFKTLFDSDSAFVQIGKIKKKMGIRYWGSNQQGLINILGINTIMVGWDFFEKKIIELNFQNQHILVYNGLPDVTKYSKTKITLSPTSKLLIPAQVALQGKKIEDSVVIDSGCNNYMVFSSKPIEEQSIDTTNTSYGKGTATGGGPRSTFAILADSIKIGDFYIANQKIWITFETNNYRRGGLLGTRTMENFIVILDFINYDLYLKKIDN